MTIGCTDFTTRHGPKKAHARFNEIYRKLDGAYSSARRRGNEKVMGGVVGIMAKMCADALLRDKLFDRGAFIVSLKSLGFTAGLSEEFSGDSPLVNLRRIPCSLITAIPRDGI